ncbi:MULTISPECIES: alpha/beta fold hydrolase [unclassified Streptomyces]|uniref:thioesterase II family protein n=1 Tax=unclassified Streptomyces TaxID=2593676 RepID=UPI002E805CCD|nr:alpha/beta fold hydrolase [Streptomyces sp. NBC_00589]WTI35483.1 thioesterase domain-containing protein [Streptomyces sp. NBC_00775]WUB30844.1 thioesterase domain-containing protein [Streptomyces sp. NBC_00589]
MTLTLMCLPYAGAGAGLFRPWQDDPGLPFRVVPVQLPGRDEWFVREPCTTMAEAARECAEQIREAAGSGPYAVFGHSFGALLAHETVRLLAAGGDRLPVRLIVSGAAAPGLPRPRMDGDALDDEAFVARLRSLVGYDHEAWHEPELRELLLPALRADLGIQDRYVPAPGGPLPVPVSVLRGIDDDLVGRADAAHWDACTTEGSELIDLPGGHMYFSEDWPLLWKTLGSVLHREA